MIWLAVIDWLMQAMMGMPPATAASKAIVRPSVRAREKDVAVFAQEGLVRGDHVLARLQEGQKDLERRIDAAHQLDGDVDLRSRITDWQSSVSNPGRQLERSRLC